MKISRFVFLAILFAALSNAVLAQEKGARLPGLGKGRLDKMGEQRRPGANAPGQQRRQGGLGPQQKVKQEILRRMNLTDGQKAQLQEINRAHQEELNAGGRRVRQARRALDQAIMSERFDQNEVNRRADELATAQSEQVRLRARIQAEFRKVLTPEQVNQYKETLREFQQRQQEQRRKEMQGGTAEGPAQPSNRVELMDVFASNS